MGTKHCLCLIFLLALLALLRSPVQARPTGSKSLPMLRVKPLEDRGGLNVRDEKGKLLNESLTTGIIQYMKERSKERVDIVDMRIKPIPANMAGQPTLTLEGDLSHVATEDTGGGPYLLTLRLVELAGEGKSRRIVAQWSGTAQTLMSLTSNLRRDPRISNDGLVGELGNRVVETVAAYGSASAQEQQKYFSHLLKTTAKPVNVTVKLVSPSQTLALNGGTSAMFSRSRFGLEVSASYAGTVYVVGVGANGQLRPLLLPVAGKEVIIAPDTLSRLPSDTFWQATETQQPVREELVVLIRRRTAPPQRETMPREAEPSSARCQTMRSQTGLGVEEPLHVMVLDGGNRILPRASGNEEIERLLEMTRNDPPGTWIVVRIPVTIVPQTQTTIQL